MTNRGRSGRGAIRAATFARVATKPSALVELTRISTPPASSSQCARGTAVPPKLPGHRQGALGRAVRHQEPLRARAARQQRPRRQPAHFPRAEHQHPAARQIAEKLFRQVRRRRPDRHRPATDVRLRPNLFGDLERALEEFVQHPRGGARRRRREVRALDLAEDFRLAEHHGLQAAHDPEKVFHAARRVEVVKLLATRLDPALGRAVTAEHFGRALLGFLALHHQVMLHAVARGDDQRLGDAGQRLRRRAAAGSSRSPNA